MPSGAPSRPSLDASGTGRPPSSAARATPPPTKSFTRMLKSSVQGTLRAAGLAGTTSSSSSRPRQNPAPNNANSDDRTLRANNCSDKRKDESRTARGLRKLEDGINFVRTRRISLRPSQPPQPSSSSSSAAAAAAAAAAVAANSDNKMNDDPGIGWAPFVSPSLRKASMSSPDLPFSFDPPGRSTRTTRPEPVTHSSPPSHQPHQPHQHHPPRPQRPQRPPPLNTSGSSFSRDGRDISRPRPLLPASVSSTSLVHGPDTPPRRNPSRNQPHTPTRKNAHSPPPPAIMRIHSASASTSQLPQFSPSSPRHPIYGASPAHYHNTSSASLVSSPHRESIRNASSLLVRELARPPQGVRSRDWEDVDIRLRSLARLERIWGKSGGGSSSTAVVTSSTMGGSEDRERRLFCETVRDGYVLCMLLNKFKPGAVARVDPREDGFAKTSNVTRFLAGAKQFGLAQDDIFQRDDLLEASCESLGRVAHTIITLCKIADSAARTSPRSPYSSTNVDAFRSSPNLRTSRTVSPPLQQHKKRPSQSGMPPLPPLPSRRSEDSNRSRDSTMTYVGRRSLDTPEPQRVVRESAPSPIPPRSPLRPNHSRASFMSTQTDSTNAPSSLLDAQTSAQFFSTVRTATTNVTSIYPAAESPFTRSDANLDLFTKAQDEYQTPLTDLPRTSRRQSLDRERIPDRLYAIGLNGSTYDVLGCVRRRERRSSELCNNDLSGVEELDEGTRRGGRPGYSSGSGAEVSPNTDSPPRGAVLPQAKRQPPIDQRDPVRLDDYQISSERREGNSSEREDKDKDTTPRSSSLLKQVEIDLSTTPPPSRPSKPAGLPYRRPMHGHRHSVDTVVHPLPLLPRFPSGSQGKNKDPNHRGSSPSGSSSRDSSTPSPGASVSVSPSALAKRNSSRPSPRGSYVPKAGVSEGPYTTGRDSEAAVSVPVLGRVPFPRTASGEHPSFGLGPGPASRLGALPSSLETLTQAEMSGNGIASAGLARNQYRGRYNSEVGIPRPRRTRPNSFDDGGIKPHRSRYESMVNLVTGSEALTRDGEIITLIFADGKEHDYRIGNLLGRGQFGSVYKALNTVDGHTIAIKRISLEGHSEDEISNLMREVEVLKRLDHPGIVKYLGMQRKRDNLNIALEYVENGSLGQTLKAFGKLNERLVSSYTAKILEGLAYLHNSDVIHCDLKAANILTTKNGNVKLSDFGVSMSVAPKAMAEMRGDRSEVAGTPHWMAPEVIELKGPSPASDIWSLACTAIELLTGHPPYHEIHNGMSVMYRIVDDDMPPVPGACSEEMRDFLMQCFKKNPADRPSAEKLFEHPWLKQTLGEVRELRPVDSIPFLRRVSLDIARSDAGRSHSNAERVAPSSPRMAESPRDGSGLRSLTLSPSPTSPSSEDFPPRSHSFVKTTFGKAVTCRVCQQSVKRSAVFCEECNLIAHARCAADAPATCDIRHQLMLYAQYSQASTAQELNSPTREGTPQSNPIAIPLSPPRRSFDLQHSESPPRLGRMLGWKNRRSSEQMVASNANSRSLAPTPIPVSRPNGTQSPTPTKRPLVRGGNSDGRAWSRVSMNGTVNTDSLRSMTTAPETASSHRESSQRHPEQGLSVDSKDRRHGSRASAASRATEYGEASRKVLRRQKEPQSPRESESSRNSGQCLVQ